MEVFLNRTTSNAEVKQKAESLASTSKNQKKTLKDRVVPWVEKFRPKTVDEVAYQDEVVSVLKKTLQGADLPNLLFYGPPGTGKTSTILACARELFGHELFRSRVLELNASDERGIQVVRDKVKAFAQLTAGGRGPSGKPCPPYKIIILDEADSMTSAAQSALRRTMEKESKSTRFCLICNYVSRIIEPLTSRCAKFRFKALSEDILRKRLSEICTAEGVKLNDEKVLSTILESSEGDMRKAITTLQSVHRLRGEDGVSEKDVMDITGMVPIEWIEGLVEVCKSNSYEQLEATLQEMVCEGFSAYQILTQLHNAIVGSTDLTDKQKAVVMERMAAVDKRLIDGADEYLQMMDLATVIMKQFCQNSE